MAKGKRKKRKPGSSRPNTAVNVDSVLAEVDALRPELENAESGSIWGDLQRLLVKAKADPAAVGAAVIGRDLQAVDHIVSVLRGLETDEPVEVESLPDIPSDTLREAMKAFRKRMKLTRLDHESKLGRSPLTTGRGAEFESILPPEQFPADVWRVLAAQGRLEATGRGFYKLPTERDTSY